MPVVPVGFGLPGGVTVLVCVAVAPAVAVSVDPVLTGVTVNVAAVGFGSVTVGFGCVTVGFGCVAVGFGAVGVGLIGVAVTGAVTVTQGENSEVLYRPWPFVAVAVTTLPTGTDVPNVASKLASP